ncbi:MAG: C10 family peptidase [Bacteroidales bacterium]|nr:C10 family peptidase [Bacteroidales bacterium]
MKKYILLFVLTSFALSVSAQDIDQETATRVAINFFYERVNQYTSTDHNTVGAGEILPVTEKGRCLLYAVNIRNGGFVLVAATNKIRPVAGYAFQGRFTKHGLPPQFSGLFDQYKLQAAYAMDHETEAPAEIKAMWKRLGTTDPATLRPLRNEKDVEPLISTQWDQGTYYNEMCPADPAGPGGHCYTGCVATALGQVVNYFRWPLTGTGSYSYSCPPYGTLTADFENSSYEYDMMATSLGKSNLAVAQLLNHLGIACDMVYGPNGSGMYNHKAAYALRTFFKYSPETVYVYRDSTSMDWDSLIISHLDRHIPLYYAGWSVPNINGHAFVCDGYQAGNYYHFNWGWSGSYDGYFYTDNLNPGGSNFNLAQELIINAFPDTVTYDYPYYCDGNKLLTSTAGTIGDGSGPVYDYLPGADCSWLIAPEDSVKSISLEFIHFNTANGDELTVYDGETANAAVLGTFQGPNIPEGITSSSDKLLLTFTSAGEAPGFLISYESELPVYCSGTVFLTAQTDTFSDGSGPRDYHNGSQCIWIINPPDASELTLYFNEFHTEETFDVVTIYDMQTQDELASFSGDITPDPVTSPSGSMFITFSSNGNITAPGWEAYYETDLVNIDEPGIFSNFQLFPNPATKQVNLSWLAEKNADITWHVYDMTGRELINQSVISQAGANTCQFDISGLAGGIYLLKAETPTQSWQQKLIIQF